MLVDHVSKQLKYFMARYKKIVKPKNRTFLVVDFKKVASMLHLKQVKVTRMYVSNGTDQWLALISVCRFFLFCFCFCFTARLVTQTLQRPMLLRSVKEESETDWKKVLVVKSK
jgi:hypothetical protein